MQFVISEKVVQICKILLFTTSVFILFELGHSVITIRRGAEINILVYPALYNTGIDLMGFIKK